MPTGFQRSSEQWVATGLIQLMNLLIVFAESIIELAPDEKSEETKQNTGIVLNVYFSTSIHLIVNQFFDFTLLQRFIHV